MSKKKLMGSLPQSGYRYIFWNARRRKWEVTITHESTKHTIGHFETVSEARTVLKEFRHRHGFMVGLTAVEGDRIFRQFKKEMGLIPEDAR